MERLILIVVLFFIFMRTRSYYMPIKDLKANIASTKAKNDAARAKAEAAASCSKPTGRAKGCICNDSSTASTQCASKQCFHRECL